MSLKLIFPIPGLQMGIMEKVRGQISYEDNNDNAELSAENQNLKVRGKQTISVTTQFFFASMSVIIILPKPGLQMAILKEVQGQLMEIISKQEEKVYERIAELSTENLNLKVRADMIISLALRIVQSMSGISILPLLVLQETIQEEVRSQMTEIASNGDKKVNEIVMRSVGGRGGGGGQAGTTGMPT